MVGLYFSRINAYFWVQIKKKKMKNILSIAACTVALSVSAQISTPQPSPAATAKQTVGLTNVEVVYSRPHRRDRVIFGDLVPYDKMWRTGANKNAMITTDDMMIFGSDTLNAGTYAIFTKPGKDKWSIYFYTDTENWGTPENWEDSKVAVEVSAKPMALSNMVESFTIAFENVETDGANLEFSWEKTKVSVPFTVATKSRVMANIESVMSGPSANDYYRAADYYLAEGKDLEQALNWINKSFEMRGSAPFWMLRKKSLILAGLGKKKEAIAVAKESLEAAQKAGNEDYVKMNEDSIKEWSK